MTIHSTFRSSIVLGVRGRPVSQVSTWTQANSWNPTNGPMVVNQDGRHACSVDQFKDRPDPNRAAMEGSSMTRNRMGSPVPAHLRNRTETISVTIKTRIEDTRERRVAEEYCRQGVATVACDHRHDPLLNRRTSLTEPPEGRPPLETWVIGNGSVKDTPLNPGLSAQFLVIPVIRATRDTGKSTGLKPMPWPDMRRTGRTRSRNRSADKTTVAREVRGQAMVNADERTELAQTRFERFRFWGLLCRLPSNPPPPTVMFPTL